MSRLTRFARSTLKGFLPAAPSSPKLGRASVQRSAKTSQERGDQLIVAFRALAAEGRLPSPHYLEIVQTLFNLSDSDPDLKAALGMAVIRQRQTDIVLNLCRHLIRDRRFLIFDIGANDGWFLDRLFLEPRDIHVIAFEPLVELQPQLQDRAMQYGHIEIEAKAVGDRASKAQLKMCAEVTGLSSLMDYEPGYRYFRADFPQEPTRTYEVEVVALDDYVQSKPALSSFDNIVLKIDTQGYEWQALQGAQQLLASGRVKAILIELVTRSKYQNSATYKPVLDHLTDLGFEIFDLLPFYREIGMQFQELPEGRLTEFDCLLVHGDFLTQFPV